MHFKVSWLSSTQMDGVNVITIEREQFTRNLNVSSYNQTKNFQTSIIIPKFPKLQIFSWPMGHIA